MSFLLVLCRTSEQGASGTCNLTSLISPHFWFLFAYSTYLSSSEVLVFDVQSWKIKRPTILHVAPGGYCHLIRETWITCNPEFYIIECSCFPPVFYFSWMLLRTSYPSFCWHTNGVGCWPLAVGATGALWNQQFFLITIIMLVWAGLGPVVWLLHCDLAPISPQTGELMC